MEYFEFYKKDFKKPEKKPPEEKKKIKSWKLVWWYNEEIKGEIIKGRYALCVWKKKEVESSYQHGELKIIPDE